MSAVVVTKNVDRTVRASSRSKLDAIVRLLLRRRKPLPLRIEECDFEVKSRSHDKINTTALSLDLVLVREK